MAEQGKSDSSIILDLINRFDTKIDNLAGRLEEKTDSSYKRLEEKLDYNSETLEKKINDWITRIDMGVETIKDKLNDHEVRIRNIENSKKDQFDKLINIMSKASDTGSFNVIPEKKDDSMFKKIATHPATPFLLFITIILVFISGNFEGISNIIQLFTAAK